MIGLMGCASIAIPDYIQEESPYKKVYYASYEDVLSSVTDVLNDLGWKSKGNVDPRIYEFGRKTPDESKQILILTELRQTPLFVGTRYAKLNIFIQSVDDNSTEVEFRYLRITSFAFNNFYRYKNDRLAQRIFNNVEKELAK